MVTFVLASIYHIEPGLSLLGVAAAECLVVSYGLAVAIERWLFKLQ